MADIINQLPDSIANQIAAGEVIQRPASVVKELVENAVDAEATEIKIVLKTAGKTLIQIVDNGKGMSHTDARMCFERHATSKISKSDDLFNLYTFGFRGEALASIAAIAYVELKTQQEGNEMGTLVKIEGSKVSTHEVGRFPKGTSISIKNLFFNVPARRKFLKSDPVELKHLLEEFTRIAIMHPEIHFSVFHNENELYHLPISNLRQRIINLFGKQINEKLVPVSEETDFLKVNGFVGKPDYTKKTRGDQYFFANGRFIKSAYLNHAMKASFENLIPSDHFPFFVLMLEVPVDHIDINIHPTKQEVKFENERLIYNYVKVAVKHALGKYSVAPTIDFEEDDYAFQRMSGSTASVSSDVATSPPYNSGGHSSQPKESLGNRQWVNVYEGLQNSIPESQPISSQPELDLTSTYSNNNQLEHTCFRTSQGYIINPIKSGFVIVDQRYAHERIVYEKCLERMNSTRTFSQKSLFPETIELSVDQAEVLKEILDKLHLIGIDIEKFGNRTYVIQGLPPGMNVSGKNLIESIIDDYSNDRDSSLKLEEQLAAVYARQTSIKRTKHLSKEEMNLLIDDLFACKMPYKSPSGHKCFVTVKEDEIEAFFK